MNHIIRKILVTALLCVGLIGISSTFCYAAEATTSHDNKNKGVTVCAVPQLYDALLVIRDQYVASNKLSIDQVNLIFRPASLMYNQIQNKEIECDVFLGNDIRYPGLLIKSEVADKDSLHAFTRAQLVLWSITSIVDESCKVLTTGVYNRISLPDPKTQASGFAALSALDKFGLHPQKIRSKLMYGANEYQTLSFIINGNVIMGILPKNLLNGSDFAKSGSFCIIPEQYYEPLYYYSVRLKTTKNTESESFITYLHNENSRKIFVDLGFL